LKTHRFYQPERSNIAQIVSKSYQHFNQGKNKIKWIFVCVKEKWRNTNKQKRKDTGRCWGCFFQHICINSTSFWGQFEGISGVNPSSLYSQNQINVCVLFMSQENMWRSSQQIYRILIATSITSLSLWGSHCATIS
jgi:hypothetical protein